MDGQFTFARTSSGPAESAVSLRYQHHEKEATTSTTALMHFPHFMVKNLFSSARLLKLNVNVDLLISYN